MVNDNSTEDSVAQDYIDSMPLVEAGGKIKKIDNHFYCKFGCGEYIFHTADEIGEKVKELVKEYF